MTGLPHLQLVALGDEPLAQALAEVGAPHLPQTLLSDHYGQGNRALHRLLSAKIAPLLEALAPALQTPRSGWPGARADVLALDLALVEHPQQPFELAWVEIQAFTTMLPTFHTMHLAQRRLGGIDARWLPHDPLPAGSNWVPHLRPWLAPHADSVLIEDHPHTRMNWPDLDAASHWWGVDVRDWRALRADDGVLHDAASGQRWTHVWNRLIFSDLDAADRRQAEATLRAADRLSWHSHPAWYEGIHKGSLADLALPAHEACHWIEHSPLCASGWAQPERWVAKSVGGHSGHGLLLSPTSAQLQALPTPRQWIVQHKFRQLPIGQHRHTGQPLFGEIRCMLGLRDGQPPWVMAWILRLSTNGIATMTGRQSAPGEGMTLLYFEHDKRASA